MRTVREGRRERAINFPERQQLISQALSTRELHRKLNKKTPTGTESCNGLLLMQEERDSSLSRK